MSSTKPGKPALTSWNLYDVKREQITPESYSDLHTCSTHTHACMHTYIHTRTCAQTYMHVYTYAYMYMHTCKKELYTEEEFLKVLQVWRSDYRTRRLHGAGRKGQLVSRGGNSRPFRRRTKFWCPNRPQWKRREQALLAEAHYRLEVERNPSKGLAQPFPQ